MQKILSEDITNYKILPFNIYSEFGEKLFAAGEVLTPGKLMQLKQSTVLYKEDNTGNRIPPIESKDSTLTKSIVETDATASNLNSKIKESEYKKSKPYNEKNVVVERFDMNPDNSVQHARLTVDNIDILNYKGPINKKAKIAPEVQIKIKAFYNKLSELWLMHAPVSTIIDMYYNIRDKIVQDILFESQDVYFCSQLKLLGEYNKCHALNTAILSGALAKKMELKEETIFDVVLAGLLHDIGKSQISDELLTKTNLTHVEQQTIESHTKIGYKIIKDEMDLPERVARVALEHHENNDGSGYPYGRSGDWISRNSQIVNVCNYFDNVTSNRTSHKVKNIKDSMHVMLEQGSKKFAADALYTFVHMFNYNDTINFEEMIL